MRRVNIAVILVLALSLTVLGARGTFRVAEKPVRGSSERVAAVEQQPEAGEKKLVDFKSDVAYSIKVADSSAICLVGRVVFYHNGAVITCDSAVRYSEKHMECFRNVIVNKDQTYAYGDRADYNGETNRARLYSDIVKVMDGDATLYTYDFVFNTLDNIGEFSGGGVVMQGDNRLESERGYYYASTREVICVEDVEMKNEEYELKSDSVAYNMDSELAQFFSLSYIWSKDGDILSAESGRYDKAAMVYNFTSDSYVLSGNNEVWADSMDYFSEIREVILRRNIQIDDHEQNIKAFGDFGHYWGEVEEAVLTLDPSALSIDAETGDTAYMCADSIFLYTIDPSHEVQRPDSLTVGDVPAGIGGQGDEGGDGMPGDGDSDHPEGDAPEGSGEDAGPEVAAGGDSEVADTLTGKAAKEARAVAARKARADKKAAAARKKAEARAARRERLRVAAEAKAAEKASRDSVRLAIREMKEEMRELERLDKMAAKRGISLDSLRREIAASDSTLFPLLTKTDSLPPFDSLAMRGDSIRGDSLRGDSLSGDSAKVQRILRGYYNVKMYRVDAQAVCDSLVAFTADSTIHMYIDPVMWNGQNQITSDVMDIYTADGQITKAVFTGSPLMCAEVDTLHYNQIAGKTIEALFRDNAIYRTDVISNAQALYYMTESGKPGIKGFIVLLSGDMSFYIENNELRTIVSRVQPDAVMYPMDKIPADQPEKLDIFKWEIGRKPTREEVFSRTVRPSRMDFYKQMPMPQFPISERISQHKERLMSEGRWNDRTEPISQDAMDFIRSKGYVPPVSEREE